MYIAQRNAQNTIVRNVRPRDTKNKPVEIIFLGRVREIVEIFDDEVIFVIGFPAFNQICPNTRALISFVASNSRSVASRISAETKEVSTEMGAVRFSKGLFKRAVL